jgi:hypothetical protein
MNSRLTEEFIQLFSRLPESVQNPARKSYRLWRSNPSHPGLRFKRVHGRDDTYSVRVCLGWRALGLVESDTIYWYWIGSHSDYDRLLKTL